MWHRIILFAICEGDVQTVRQSLGTRVAPPILFRLFNKFIVFFNIKYENRIFITKNLNGNLPEIITI